MELSVYILYTLVYAAEGEGFLEGFGGCVVIIA
jgi:hypothetical protein